MDNPAPRKQDQLRVFAGNLVNPCSAKNDILITIQNGEISSLSSIAAHTPAPADIDARAHTVIPGLIDIHTHGALGESFTLDCTQKSRQFLASRGTTAFLATSFPVAREEYLAGLAKLRTRISTQKPAEGAQILGIRCEGPFLEPSLGAQSADLCWPINSDNISLLLDAAGEDLKILDLSPELPDAETLITLATAQGVIVSAAHSAANAQQMDRAFRAGLSHATHVLNANKTPPAPAGMGVLGVGADEFSLANQAMTAEVIVDSHGYHVSPYWLEILFR